MLNAVNNLYKSHELNGEFFVIPLKSYHNFFAKKIDESRGLVKGASIIGNIATGIFAYPIFGLLAGVGMLIKLAGVNHLKNRNNSDLDSILGRLNDEKRDVANRNVPDIDRIVGDIDGKQGFRPHVVKTFIVEQENQNILERDIRFEVNETLRFRKTYIILKTLKNEVEPSGKITIQLNTLEPV